MSDRPRDAFHGASAARGPTKGSKAGSLAGDETITDQAGPHHLVDMIIAAAEMDLALGIACSPRRQIAVDRGPRPGLGDLAQTPTGRGAGPRLDTARPVDSMIFPADTGATFRTFSFSSVTCPETSSTGCRDCFATGASRRTSCLSALTFRAKPSSSGRY